MKPTKADLPTSRNVLTRSPYFPSLLTTPIPDGNKFAPNHNLVSDISCLSESEKPTHSNKSSKVATLQRTHTSKQLSKKQQQRKCQKFEQIKSLKNHRSSHKLSMEKMLIRLRRKHGLPISDDLNYDISSSSLSSMSSPSSSGSDSDTESESDIDQSSKKHKKSKKKGHKKSSKNSQSSDFITECIASLHQKQAELREYILKKSSQKKDILHKLPKPEKKVQETKNIANDKKNCHCNNNENCDTSINSWKSQTSQDRIEEFYKKQQEQLLRISNQMQELLNIHKEVQNSGSSQSVSSSNPFLQDDNVLSPKQKESLKEKSPMLRSIQTNTSFFVPNSPEKDMKNDKNLEGRFKIRNESNKSLDYLDTSIEKVREDIRKDFYDSNSSPISQKINSMFPESGTIYHTIDNKLTSDNISNSKIADNSSSMCSSSSKYRSSCSVTPERTSFYRTSSPKRYFKESNNPFRGSNPFKEQTEQTFTRVYHSEQSFCVQQLASKYNLGNYMNFPDMKNYKKLPISYPGTYHDHRFEKDCEVIPKTLWNDPFGENSDKDIQKYSLSDMNTSVATKKYLEKYGLLNESFQKRDRRERNCDMICERDEQFFDDDYEKIYGRHRNHRVNSNKHSSHHHER